MYPKNGVFCSVFEKIHSTRGELFSPVHRKTLIRWKYNIMPYKAWAECMIYNIIVFETLRFQFVLQDGNDKPVFSHAFSVAVFTGYLWMVGQRGEKNLRSQTKPDRYGWGQ